MTCKSCGQQRAPRQRNPRNRTLWMKAECGRKRHISHPSCCLQLSFSFFVWLSLWLGMFMLTSYTYAFTQLDEKFFYASSRDYNDSAQMVCAPLPCVAPVSR